MTVLQLQPFIATSGAILFYLSQQPQSGSKFKYTAKNIIMIIFITLYIVNLSYIISGLIIIDIINIYK